MPPGAVWLERPGSESHRVPRWPSSATGARLHIRTRLNSPFRVQCLSSALYWCILPLCWLAKEQYLAWRPSGCITERQKLITSTYNNMYESKLRSPIISTPPPKFFLLIFLTINPLPKLIYLEGGGIFSQISFHITKITFGIWLSILMFT